MATETHEEESGELACLYSSNFFSAFFNFFSAFCHLFAETKSSTTKTITPDKGNQFIVHPLTNAGGELIEARKENVAYLRWSLIVSKALNTIPGSQL